jgi:heme/copper-type cytochrome/quinol oxidase subunit 2
MIGVGLTAVLSVMAIIVSVVALASKSSTTTVQAAWTATDLGVNQRISAGSETVPSKTTFTFSAPSAGKYEWWCALPCDPYAMSTDGD